MAHHLCVGDTNLPPAIPAIQSYRPQILISQYKLYLHMGSLLYLKLSVTKTELLHILQKKSFFPCAQNFCLFFINIYL